MRKLPPKITYAKPDPLPVFVTLTAAVRDTAAALRVMPAFFLAAFFIFFAKRLIRGPVSVPPIDGGEWLAPQVWALLETVGMALLTVPIILAFHRFAILKERSSPASLLVRRETILLYVIVSMLPTVAMSLVVIAGSALPEEGLWAIAAVPAVMALGSILFWSCRCALALPAIAVDAPNASLSGSARATRGSFWRMFAVISLPMFVPMAFGYWLTILADGLAGAAGFAVCATIALATATMALSHAYIWRSQGPHGRSAALRCTAAESVART